MGKAQVLHHTSFVWRKKRRHSDSIPRQVKTYKKIRSAFKSISRARDPSTVIITYLKADALEHHCSFPGSLFAGMKDPSVSDGTINAATTTNSDTYPTTFERRIYLSPYASPYSAPAITNNPGKSSASHSTQAAPGRQKSPGSQTVGNLCLF